LFANNSLLPLRSPVQLNSLLSMQPLIILGTGGSAYDILDTVDAINARAPTWSLAGFLDDVRPVGSTYLGLPILGGLDEACRFADHRFVNAIGSDKSFRRRPEILVATGLASDRFAPLIHPAASVSPRASLGHGVCVHFGISVGGGAKIGNHVSLYPACIIGHDAVVEDYTIIAPGAVISGFVHLSAGCYIGAGAVIRQQLEVGEKALVCMGAVVVKDVDPSQTVVGNPARVLACSTRTNGAWIA
jgi:sugar O-acyltransferase (sialic acid O-acetyltransferase NeuD family)